MPKLQIVIREIKQHIQDIGTEGGGRDRLLATFLFDIHAPEGVFVSQSAQVSQPYGTSSEDELEVHSIEGEYSGRPWNHVFFAERCGEFYRNLVGPAGALIRIEGEDPKVHMVENTFKVRFEFEIEVPEPGGSGW